jgi:predicted tellurium resistance membrane protein TerC
VFAVDSIPAIFGVTEVRYRTKLYQNKKTHCIA